MARAHKGIDQATAGKIIGTSHAHIRAVENGEKPMNDGQVYMLAHAVELPMEFFTADWSLLAAEATDTSDQLDRIEQSVIEMSSVLGLQPQARPEPPPRTSPRTEAGTGKPRRVKVPVRSGQQGSPAQVHPIQKRQPD